MSRQRLKNVLGVKLMKRIVSIVLSVMMIAGVFTSLPLSASAAKSLVSLKKNSADLKITKKKDKTVYGKVKITVKKEKGVKIKKISYKSKKTLVAKVSKKGIVTAKKKGFAEIKVTVKFKYKNSTKKTVLTFKVNVTDKRNNSSKPVVKPTIPVESNTETTEAVETTEAAEATEQTTAETTAETTEATEQTTAQETETEAPSTIEPETTAPATEVQEETTFEETEYIAPQETTAETAAAEAGGEANQDITEDTSAATEEASAATEVATIEETLPAPETFNEKLSAFSNKLYTMTAAEQDENYIFSPVSVYFALSLLYSIGDDNVKKDIEEFVGMSDEEIIKSGELKYLRRQVEFQIRFGMIPGYRTA